MDRESAEVVQDEPRRLITAPASLKSPVKSTNAEEAAPKSLRFLFRAALGSLVIAGIAAGLFFWGAGEDSEMSDSAQETHAVADTLTATANQTEREVVAHERNDWADSTPLPPWVAAGALPEDAPRPSGATRAYQPLLNAQTVPGATPPFNGVQAGSYASDGPRQAATSGTSGPNARVGAFLLATERHGEWSAMPLTAGAGASAGLWALPGQCSGILRVAEDGMAESIGAALGRRSAILVPNASCESSGAVAVPVRAPGEAERLEMERAVAASAVVRQLGAPSFSAHQLVSIAIHGMSDGSLAAWGVFRQPARSTRVVPPPEAPQLAFVATRAAGGSAWRIEWAKLSMSARETLELAGVVSPEGSGVPRAVWVVLEGESARALLVGRQGVEWGLVESRSL